MNAANSAVADLIGPVLSRLAQIAPRPASLEATGLPPEMLTDLALKHLLRGGPLTSAALGERLGLAGPVLEPILQFLRQEGRLQLQARASFDNELRLALTERGRQSAADSLQKCGYVGPAPVPLETYARIVRAQTLPRRSLTREGMRLSLSGIIITDELCDRLGVAMASGRAIFIYGPAGSGKTYTASRLIGALSGEVLIPHAIAVNDKIIRLFDAAVHERLELIEGNRRLLLAQGYDARFALCERPLVIVGGELTLEMLEVQFNAAMCEYQAPLQMKANNGLLVIDDLGRQRFLPQRLFDRWIVPLEQHIDYLAAGADARFTTPCDAIVVFSTNLEPTELADDAVVRRLGYKIELGPLSDDMYRRVWAGVCAEMKVPFDQELFDYALTKLYPATGHPLLACHPRDLICMALDKAVYDERGGQFEAEDLRWAWKNYFLPSVDGSNRGATATPR
jgi:predicted ATPase with chaperone activity